jgi:probable addiction module antidote protein
MEPSMETETTAFSSAKRPFQPADLAELLNDALATGDASHVASMLGAIARARGMTKVARGSGVSRETLYKGLTDKGNPKLSTLLGILRTLDLELSARTSKRRRRKAAQQREAAQG